MHHGSLDFQEPPAVQERTDETGDLGPGLEYAANLLVGYQVEVTLPVTYLDVLEPVPFLRQRPQGLGKHGHFIYLNGDLPGVRLEYLSANLQDIPYIELSYQRQVFAFEGV
jgi:hypothetical protein